MAYISQYIPYYNEVDTRECCIVFLLWSVESVPFNIGCLLSNSVIVVPQPKMLPLKTILKTSYVTKTTFKDLN